MAKEKEVETKITNQSDKNLICVSGSDARKYSELDGKAGSFITVGIYKKLIAKSKTAEASSKGGGKTKSKDDEEKTNDSARSDDVIEDNKTAKVETKTTKKSKKSVAKNTKK